MKDQLPYLGIEQMDGTIKIAEHITLEKDDVFAFRPDYKEFKSKMLNSEFDCVGVLTGIARIVNCMQLIEQILNELSPDRIIHFPEVLNYPEGRDWYAFDKIMHSIREIIDLGVSSEEIKAVKIKESHSTSGMYFKPNVFYNGLQFLHWAQRNSFPIPEELQFVEDGNGGLFWVEKKDSIPKKPNVKQVEIFGNENIGLDKLIKNITIRYENDSQITIQRRGKQPIPVTLQNLRFQATGKKQTWNNLLKVLQSPPNYYWDFPLNQMKTVSQRLKEWIVKNFTIDLPDKFTLYKREKGKGPGIYSFNFNIEYSNTINEDESSKKTFRKKFFIELDKSLKDPHNDFIRDNISKMAKEGLIKYYFTEEEIQTYLASDTPEVNFSKTQDTNLFYSK